MDAGKWHIASMSGFWTAVRSNWVRDLGDVMHQTTEYLGFNSPKSIF